jgi:hypothetical protein
MLRTVPAGAKLIREDGSFRPHDPAKFETSPAAATTTDRERFEHVRLMMLEKATAVVAISVAVLALAALGTVCLVFAAHTATIRRVNATLVEISEQLKQMRQPGPP